MVRGWWPGLAPDTCGEGVVAWSGPRHVRGWWWPGLAPDVWWGRGGGGLVWPQTCGERGGEGLVWP